MYTHGFLKVAVSSPRLRLGDSMYNTKEIIKVLGEAEKKNSSMICFPELCITGYSIGDLLFQKSVYEDNLKAIKFLLDNNPYKGVIILGSYVVINDTLYNCAFVIQNKKVLGVIPKKYLPHTNEFYEARWFSSGKYLIDTVDSINLFGESVPFGKLLFANKERDVVFGAEICGDVWAPTSPNELLYANGALIVFNPSASPEYIGKGEKRRILTRSVTQKFNSSYVYVSNNASESTSEVVFSSHKIISESGKILAEDDEITLDSTTIYADIDIHKLHFHRRTNSYFKQAHENSRDDSFKIVNFNLEKSVDLNLETKVEKLPFVPKENKSFKMILDIIAASIKKRLEYIGIDSTVLGFSGGLDSTVALLSLVYTYDKYSLDKKNIHALLLPTSNNSTKSLENSKKIVETLGVTYKVIDISDDVSKGLEIIEHPGGEDITYENVQARFRTYTLMNYANLNKGIVIGTSDMSEIALGWSTFNGDHMAMYGLNSGMPKTVIRALLEYQKNNFPELEDSIELILKAPISPELKGKAKDGSVQKTEDVIGKYEINDFILYHFLVNGDDEERIVYLLKNIFELSDQAAQDYVTNFMTRFFKNQFKRLTMPEGVKIMDISLSPRSELKINGDVYYQKK